MKCRYKQNENGKTGGGDVNMPLTEIQSQKREWRKKSWSIPDLLGGKQNYFSLVKQLVELLGTGGEAGIDTQPELEEISAPKLWREYTPFLQSLGLVNNCAGTLRLTDAGAAFYTDLTKRHLADLMQKKFRLFGEVLEMLAVEPGTVQEIDAKICKEYHLDWTNCSNTRRRLDWLEVLELIQSIGNRKWQVTEEGHRALKELRV